MSLTFDNDTCLFGIIQFMNLVVTSIHSFLTERTMKTSVTTNAKESDEYRCLLQEFILYLFRLFSFGFRRVVVFDPYSAVSFTKLIND